MSTPIPVFLNANAGVFSSSLSAEQMQAAAREAGLEVEPIITDSTDEMAARLKRFVEEKRERIGIAGGDGTVAIAAQVLARSETALGIIPQGTFNNFATALRLPQDLPSALRVLREGEARDVDLGCVEVCEHRPRFFTEASGVGLFADGLALYGKGSNKNFLRGFKAITRVLLSLRARRLELTLDGQKYSERAVMCICANTFRMAQGVPVAPEAKLTDGALDVILVGDLSPGEVLSYYRAFRAQTHLDLPKITHHRAKRITITGRRHMNVHCDDAFVGTTPATISSQPRALKVLLGVL
jgi:diacylglycerol kinase (ATP)